MNFLPKTYEIPLNGDSHYFKFEDGENRFRVLSPATTGWLYWVDAQQKPLERPVKGCKAIHVPELKEIAEATRKIAKIKHWWAFVVYNYSTKGIQVAKLTQKPVMKAMWRYAQDPEWGDLTQFDFVVQKTGQSLETEYQVTVKPKAPLDEGILKMYQDMSVDLTALYRGEDPFGKNSNGKSKA